MVNEIIIPKENIAKIEEIREIDSNHKIPSFEEFMKTYEENVNYDDLNGGDVGESKRYGPCIPHNPNCNCTAEELRRQIKGNRTFRVIMNTNEWDANLLVGTFNGTIAGAHWYSDRKNHGNIPGNWVEKTWGNFFGGNVLRIGDWEATEIRLENIEMGRRALDHMDRGWLKIRLGKNILGTLSTNAVQLFCNDEPTVYVKNKLREEIRKFENGQSVDTNINFS